VRREPCIQLRERKRLAISDHEFHQNAGTAPDGNC
jgi:hypothetical protein